MPLLLACMHLNGCSTVNSAKLLAPETFGLQQIAHNIYVEPRMPRQEREALLKAVDIARQRILLYYGSVLSGPEFVACSSEPCFQSLGGNTARAKSYGNQKILISPRGLTVPIITHEWSHAELFTRVDGLFTMTRIPRWFDEGLAVVVSNEPTHSEGIWREIQNKGIVCPDMDELQTRNDWLRATRKYGDATLNKDGYRVVYACAGHEVRRWYRRAGKSGLAHFIATVRYKSSFAEAYAESEGRFKTVQR
jgi:hypothetical protein